MWKGNLINKKRQLIQVNHFVFHFFGQKFLYGHIFQGVFSNLCGLVLGSSITLIILHSQRQVYMVFGKKQRHQIILISGTVRDRVKWVKFGITHIVYDHSKTFRKFMFFLNLNNSKKQKFVLISETVGDRSKWTYTVYDHSKTFLNIVKTNIFFFF